MSLPIIHRRSEEESDPYLSIIYDLFPRRES